MTSNDPDLLYHYCSNMAFLSIVSTKTLWASEFTLSNDHLEGKWLRRVVEACCDDRKIAPHYKIQALEALDVVIGAMGAVGVCLSEEGDLLSQWRAYSENGSGVSIGFFRDRFGSSSALPSLQKIEYNLDRQKLLLAPKLEQAFEILESGTATRPTLLTQASDAAALKRYEDSYRKFMVSIFALFPFLFRFKNPAFQEEREWRSINYIPNSTEVSEFTLAGMDFRGLTDRIVPFQKYELDNNASKSAIAHVILGPRNLTPSIVVEAALARHGWHNIKVTKSDASYR
jgi:hypothetical protein